MDADILKCKADILRARDVLPPYDKKPPAQKSPSKTDDSGAAEEATAEKGHSTQEAPGKTRIEPPRGREKPSLQPAAAEPSRGQIPRFDLADNIMAEQRRVAAARRRAPGDVTVERQSHKTAAFDSRPGRRESSPSPEGEIISAIVARDIEALCCGDG